jgi:hypothetical protein
MVARCSAVEPRFRGPEIVSPLEGEDSGAPIPEIHAVDGGVHFSVTAESNPNNTTPAMQGLMIRARLDPDATIRATLCGQDIAIPAIRLYDGAKSGNLGPIDSPAWRFHQMPRPPDWQWQGACASVSLWRVTRSICACVNSAGRWHGPHRSS